MSAPRRPVSRRGFLGGAGAALSGAAVIGTATADGAPRSLPRAAAAGPATPEPFHGAHQPGVLPPPAPHGLLATFRCVDRDRTALAGTFRELSGELEALMAGARPGPADPALPPPDNGVLDDVADPGLTATLSVGASLFDGRYGLAARRPRELLPMRVLANDRLDPARTHGDVLLHLQAGHPDVCVHALRRAMRATRSGLVLHWMLDGFTRPDAVPAPGQTRTRNLLGFKDGTANPDATDPALMDDLVWVGSGDGEPEWAVGGTYQAVRVIRMFVEQWDRASLTEQQQIIGRRKADGAPLDGDRETDPPRYPRDPDGQRIPLDAHIRLANPRAERDTAQRILRRGMSYSRGLDGAGLLDQGLAFVSYQRRLAHFLRIQARLTGEPLEEYLLPEGGGFFYVLPGVPEPGDWLGRPLLAP